MTPEGNSALLQGIEVRANRRETAARSKITLELALLKPYY
jgi:hypothetical protein